MKRLFDISLALGGLIFFSPLALLIALFIKMEDSGPVFFVQERWGRGGRRFKAYKFRTMIHKCEEAWGHKPAEVNDARITRTGKLLRRTAMDELPQLVNILKGDMSFVGPRALAVGSIDPAALHFSERHSVRPGLTGPTQILLSRDAALEEKFRYDVDYIKNRSFWMDLRLMFLSLWISCRGKWEHRKGKL